MSRSKTHALAWADAVRDSEVSTSARAVALACLTYADYGSGANMRAGTALLADRSGLKDRATRNALHELVAAGLLTWDGRPTAPGLTRCYSLTIPERRHPGATVQLETVAPRGRNGGTYVQPTSTRPQAALRGAAPEGTAPRSQHPYEDDAGVCAVCALPPGNARHGSSRQRRGAA